VLRVEERFVMRELSGEGASIGEIARRTGHDRKTIRAAVTYRSYLEERLTGAVYNSRPSIRERQIRELATRRFVAQDELLPPLGPPGVGRSPMAITPGMPAINQGSSVSVLTVAERLARPKLVIPARA